MLRAYLSAMPALSAERQLQRIEAASFPHMTDRGRSGLLRGLQRLINRKSGTERSASRPEDFAAAGIPVTYVKAAE